MFRDTSRVASSFPLAMMTAPCRTRPLEVLCGSRFIVCFLVGDATFLSISGLIWAVVESQGCS